VADAVNLQDRKQLVRYLDYLDKVSSRNPTLNTEDLYDQKTTPLTVVLANSDLADTVGVAHFPSILAASRVIGIARVHNVCLPHSSGVAA
jgi:hypothetical protein